jgi:hypothetical protein
VPTDFLAQFLIRWNISSVGESPSRCRMVFNGVAQFGQVGMPP